MQDLKKQSKQTKLQHTAEDGLPTQDSCAVKLW